MNKQTLLRKHGLVKTHINTNNFFRFLRFFSSNKNNEAQYSKTALSKNSLDRTYSGNSNLAPSSGCHMQVNQFPQRNFNSSLEYTLEKTFNTCSLRKQASTYETIKKESRERCSIEIAVDKSPNDRDTRVTSLHSTETPSHSKKTIRKEYKHGNVYSTTAMDTNFFKRNNYRGYKFDTETTHRGLHTTVKEKDNSRRTKGNPFRDKKKSKDVILINRYTLRNANLSDAAKKLLRDLNITPNVKDNELSGRLVDKKSKKNELATLFLDKFNDLRNSAVITKMISGNNYSIIADYYKDKAKPFSIESRLWNNYIQAHLNMMRKLHANNINPNTFLKERSKISPQKWESKKTNRNVIIEDLDVYKLVTKVSYSFIRSLLGSIKEFCHSIISRLQSESVTKTYMKPDRETWKYLFRWRTKKKFLKEQRYDFTIKPIGKSSNSQKSAIRLRRSMKFPGTDENFSLGDFEDIDKKRRNLKVAHQFENKESESYLNKISFFKQFKKRPDTTELYYADNVDNRKTTPGEKSPEFLLRFCWVLRNMMIRMNELNVINDTGQHKDSANKTEHAINNTSDKQETCDLEDSCFRLTLHDLSDTKKFKVFAVNNKNENTVPKGPYLNVKVKPHCDCKSFSKLQIDDMQVYVCENNECSLKEFRINRSGKTNNTILNKSLNSPMRNTSREYDKCVLVDLRLRMPFSSKAPDNTEGSL